MTTVRDRSGTRVQQELRVAREGIRFRNVAPRRVRVEITVENPARERSAPSVLRLQAAAFGAFLPWKDVVTLSVPSIAPGSSVVVATELDQGPRVRTLRAPPHEPPTPARVATGFADGPRDPGAEIPALARLAEGAADRRAAAAVAKALRRLFGGLAGFASASKIEDGWARMGLADVAATMGDRTLPLDLREPLGDDNPHWAGNFNVLVGATATERHMARAVRIHPGRTNIAFFFLGERLGTYWFAFRGEGAAWGPRLVTSHGELVGKSGLERVPATRAEKVALLLAPPSWAERGKLDVVVTHRPSGEVAVVEFDLDSAAPGPGCVAA